MPIAAYDRVRESTTTTGTGTITLAGVAAGPYQSFAVVGNGNQCVYCIADQSGVGNDWEVGIGTYSTTGPSLARTTVTGSSNSGNLVNFPAGVKDVFVVYSAARSVDLGDVGTAPNQIPLNQYLGKLAFMDVLDTISNNPYYDTQISDVEPTLNLDFVNSKTLDSRITFTRSTTATYYDGKSSAVAEQNLFTYSQDFSNSIWIKPGNSIIVNSTSSPDGTSTASTFTQTNSSLTPTNYQSFTATASTYTYSIYLKAGTDTTHTLSLGTAGQALGAKCTFDLSTGTVGSVTNYGSTTGSTASISTITPNGFYRCSITVLCTSATYFCSEIASTLGNTVFIWGAQVEQRSSATAYNATTTTALTNYIPTLQTAPINTARLDYNPVTGTPNGLLIEEQRTNLCLYSSDISNSWWNKASASVSVNATADIAPDGTQTANQLIESTNNSPHRVLTTAFTKAASAIAYSWTFYAKANQRGYCWSSLQSSLGNGIIVYFSLNTGAVTSAPAAIGTAFTSVTTTSTSVGNGWYRFVLTATSDTDTALYGYIGLSVDGTSQSYTGNGYSSIYAWGAQLEAGSFPTSYIPTVASQVTRSADSATMPTTGWFNPAQGTAYCSTNVNSNVLPTNGFLFAFNNGNYTDSWYTEYNNGFINSNMYVNSVFGTAISIVSNPNKTVSSYINNIKTLETNGGSSVSNSYQSPALSAINALKLGGQQGGASRALNGCITKFTYYPQALSNAELQEMTS